MGDSYDSDFMDWAQDTLKKAIPGLDTYAVRLDESSKSDQLDSVMGDSMTDVLEVCDQLNNITELADGFNAIGFSQGGLFLRAAVEVCGLPVKTLVTYGSPHNGINDLPPCDNWICKKRNALLRQHMYDDDVQSHSIQAQYFREENRYDEYLENSAFLKFVNNEFVKNITYARNLAKLDRLVLIKFTEDVTLVPKESAWYNDVEPVTGIPLSFTETESFKYNLVGTRSLYEKKKIDFLEIPAEHMQIDQDDLLDVAYKYL